MADIQIIKNLFSLGPELDILKVEDARRKVKIIRRILILNSKLDPDVLIAIKFL